MPGNFAVFFCILFLFLLTGLASSTPFISYSALESHAGPSRSLLQQKKKCPIDFQHQNYTILTSECKGPKYDPNICCIALKRFGCKFTNEINDMETDCATTMFSYINLYGKYPPGLFANTCREEKNGLDCNALPPAQNPIVLNSGQRPAAPARFALLSLSCSFLVLLWLLCFF